MSEHQTDPAAKLRADAFRYWSRSAERHERDARFYRSQQATGPQGAIADEARRWAEAHEATAARCRQTAAIYQPTE